MTDKEFNEAMVEYYETHGAERTLKALCNHLCIIAAGAEVEFECRGHGYTVDVSKDE
ncbi:hypothetical protein [Marinobacterium litorale]|uniref:hypothetical protein n=1 Tax=Marinobacterium litorale TaxID=404770 RepID=UPI0004021292|nr:hypothetical protein [Marinobacterium litorale]